VAALDTSYQVDPEEIERVRAAVEGGDVEGAARAIGDETLQRFVFAGTPADIERQVGELAEAGVTRIEFGTPHGFEEAEGIRLLGRVVAGFR
ncbi:MAG TPA: hypothetical protein VER55_07965, partial [Ardenticatenaceae bacterium]|nr:hypothetical protein [Ardenticatenaceae bacterium]